MVDCLELDFAVKPARVTRPIDLFREWKRHNRLRLSRTRELGPQRLEQASQAASNLGLPTRKLEDGSLVILDLTLEEALSFARRFADLCMHYEPAREPATH